MDLDIDKMESVQRMQDYIKENVFTEDFSFEAVYSAGGYSNRHCERIFKELLNMTVREYVRAVRLSKSSRDLQTGKSNILDIALDTKYNSHEGFTRAFTSKFNVTPDEYRRAPIPIPRFIQYPIRDYYTLLQHKEMSDMNSTPKVCTVTLVHKPQRKLVFLRSRNSKDYLSFCTENGCEWEGLLNSIEEKLDTAAILTLPKSLIKDGTSNIAAGLELPIEYNGKIPDGYESVILEECDMLYFQSEPYEDGADFCTAIDSVFKAMENYNYSLYGYELSPDSAPSFNFGAEPKIGARIAVAIKVTNSEK